MKPILKVLCVIALGLAVSVPAYAAEKTITLGTMVWSGMKTDMYITKHVLEDQGYNVKMTEFSEWGIAFAALAKGDIQVLGVHINYVAQPYFNRYKSFLEKVSPFSYGLYQALAVPDYVKIDSMEQLNDHVKEFDGKIIGVESGTGINRETKEAIKAYDLKYKMIPGSTAAMTAALTSAIQRKAPILVTMWTPFWPMAKYNLHFLKDPKHAFAPKDTYEYVAHKGFSAKHPRAREVLASIFIPMPATLQMMGYMKEGATAQEAADRWVKENADLVKRWENIKKY